MFAWDIAFAFAFNFFALNLKVSMLDGKESEGTHMAKALLFAFLERHGVLLMKEEEDKYIERTARRCYA